MAEAQVSPPQRDGRAGQRCLTWCVVALIAVGFGLRLGIIVLHDYIGNADQVLYTKEALRLLDAEMPQMRPGLAPLIALPILLGVPETLAARVMTLAFGTLLLGLIYLLVRAAYGPLAGLAALFLAAFSSHLITASTNGMAEAPALCAVVGALALIVPPKEARSPWLFLGAGMLIGYAFSIRSEAVIHFAGILAASAILLWGRGRNMLALVGFLFLGFLLVGGGAMLARGKPPTMQAGTDMSTPNALLQYDPMFAGEGEELREVLTSRVPQEWLDDIDLEPPQLTWEVQAKRYVHNLHKQISEVLPSTIDIGLWVLIAMGLFGERWRSGRWKTEIIFAGLWLFFFTAAPLAQLVHPRHLLLYLVIGICWAGVGAVNFGRWYSRTKCDGELRDATIRRGIVIALIFAALFQLKPGADFVQAAFNGEVGTEEKRAGLWLSEYAESEDVALERKTVVAFYAGIGSLELPHVSLERVVEYARMNGAEYVIVSSRHLEKYRPQLMLLLEDDPVWQPDLKLIHEERNRYDDDLFVRIFEVQHVTEMPSQNAEGSAP